MELTCSKCRKEIGSIVSAGKFSWTDWLCKECYYQVEDALDD